MASPDFINFNQKSRKLNSQVNVSFAPEMNFAPAGSDADAGKTLFQTKACFACHGMNLEGNALGPNLIDNFSKHGCSAEEMTKVINKGVAGTAMVAFETQLKPEEVKQLVAFIISLKGSNPANAKAPEGEKCK